MAADENRFNIRFRRRQIVHGDPAFAPMVRIIASNKEVPFHSNALVWFDGMVGLELEPVSGRRLPDIEGTLWLDGVTGRLIRLDFKYVNLGWAVKFKF